MTTFKVMINIAATPAAIWRVLIDVERWPEWTSSVTAIHRLDTGAFTLGSRVRIEQPKLRPAVWTVTSWQPEKEFTWRSTRPGLVTTAEHRIEQLGDNRQVMLAVSLGGLLGSIAGMIAGRLTKQYIDTEAAGLKRRCETETKP
jgi:hypothetical protein